MCVLICSPGRYRRWVRAQLCERRFSLSSLSCDCVGWFPVVSVALSAHWDDMRRRRSQQMPFCLLQHVNTLKTQVTTVVRAHSRHHVTLLVSPQPTRFVTGVFSTLLAALTVSETVVCLLLGGDHGVLFQLNLGKAAEGGTGRNSVFRPFPGVVFGGSPPRLRRRHLHPLEGEAGPGAQAAARCGRRHHPGVWQGQPGFRKVCSSC